MADIPLELCHVNSTVHVGYYPVAQHCTRGLMLLHLVCYSAGVPAFEERRRTSY